MGALFRFVFLAGIKILSRLFYTYEVEWVGTSHPSDFPDAKIGILLNHTTLFEPVLFGILPFWWLWEVAQRGVLPGADSTLDRPFVGHLFKWMSADTIGVTRNRDRTWTLFLSKIHKNSIVLMAPEGRMKRRNGLDKHGRPMTVKGGIVDVLDRFHSGTMIVLYSAGLHHVQAPDEGLPNLFQHVRARLEAVPIEKYKKEHHYGTPGFRMSVMKDLERRRDLYCRWD